MSGPHLDLAVGPAPGPSLHQLRRAGPSPAGRPGGWPPTRPVWPLPGSSPRSIDGSPWPPLLSPPPQSPSADAVALSGRFPLLAGVDLEVGRGGDGPGQRTERGRQDEPPAGVRRSGAPRLGATSRSSASTCRTTGSTSVGVSGCSPTRPTSTTTSPSGRTSASPSGPPAATWPGSRPGPRPVGPRRTAGQDGRRVGLSAGQRRRVALAVLTARWPELWLLDEPHAGLDASARALLDEAVTEAGRLGRDRAHRQPRAGPGRGASPAGPSP